MFENPNTIWIEILALVAIVTFIAIMVGVYIYKKIKHLPTGECAYCKMNTKKMLNQYHKKYSNK